MTTRLRVTIPLCGPAFQSFWTSPALTSSSMSLSSESTAMSASNPEAMARLWAPEPLYDSSNRTSGRSCRFQLRGEGGQERLVERLADDRVGADGQDVVATAPRPVGAQPAPGSRGAEARHHPGALAPSDSSHASRHHPVASFR